MNGWPVFGVLAALLTAAFAGALALFGGDEAGLRALVRFTARTSFAAFLIVYVTAPLRRLLPSPASRWMLRNRRYLGVSFAWAHGLHALAIALLAALLGAAFEADPVTVVFGGFGYALTAAMALTSFDATARWLGPPRWKHLHRTGLHTLWVIFAFNWTVSALTSPFYLPFAALAWGAAGLRFAAARASFAQRAQVSRSEPKAGEADQVSERSPAGQT